MAISHRLKPDALVNGSAHLCCIEHNMLASHLQCKRAGGLDQRGSDPLLASRRDHSHTKQSCHSLLATGHVQHTSSHHLMLLERCQMPDMPRMNTMQSGKDGSFFHTIIRKIIYLPC